MDQASTWNISEIIASPSTPPTNEPLMPKALKNAPARQSRQAVMRHQTQRGVNQQACPGRLGAVFFEYPKGTPGFVQGL